ncbi:MAG: DMT family transporter [Lawsonibacter sp.]|jgi:drug/metabolite transporter (DMT)-like permease|nr:DMT family transporter [Lawsonibacter sp.]MCI9655407.1 DMT family transporter [Lawsonibacter sp.]
MIDKSRGQAFGLLFLTFFLWGSVYVGGKLLTQELSPALVACLRCSTAMVPLLLMARPHLHTKIQREDWKYFILVGVLGYFLTIFLIQIGIALTGSAMASLINALTPVSVTILAALLLKETITPVKLLCLALALAGTAVITQGAGSQSELLGIAAVLISVVFWGFASVFMRRLTAKYPAVLVTTYGMAISLIFHIPAGILAYASQPVAFTPKIVLVVLYLGFFGSGVAQYTWTRCLSILPASTCSLFYPLQPVFAALLGAVILKETFTSTFAIGLALISLDVVLSTWETKKLAEAKEQK